MLNISKVLRNLNKYYQTILDNVIDPYYFSDEPDETGINTNIDDGGGDMYDDANCLNTNLTQLYADLFDGNADNDTVRENSIYYTHTVTGNNNPDTGDDWDNDYINPPMDGIVADGSSYFGSGSQYFTNMYPDMFVMGATGIAIEEFSITGNIGADGSGSYEVNTFTLTSNGLQFTCFNKQVYDSGDPSINHFIFVPGNGSGIDHLYDEDNEDDDDCIQNISSIDEIYYLLIAKQENLYMDSTERLNIAQAFLDVITIGINQQQYLHPEISFKVKTYDPATFISQLPPDGNIENLIYQLRNQTVWIPGWPYPLKHDDIFTLYGQAASDLKRKLSQINSGGSVLEIYVPPEQNTIYIFTNDNYVDYVSNPGADVGHEANNLMIYMTSENISFEQFTSISSSSFEDIANNAGFMIIPEISNGDLLPDLTSAAKTEIARFVDDGGTLLMFNPSSGDVIGLLNDIFSFSIGGEGGSADVPINLTAEGLALFPSFDATILSNDGTSSLDSSTLPAESVVIYEGDGANQAVVCQIPYGTGFIYVLGWDWYDAAPQGSQDDGWNNILKTIITG